MQERLETKSHSLLKQQVNELEAQLLSSTNAHDLAIATLKDQLKSKQTELDNEANRWSHDYNTLLSSHKNLELKISQVSCLLFFLFPQNIITLYYN
jgi:hypothetical protein